MTTIQLPNIKRYNGGDHPYIEALKGRWAHSLFPNEFVSRADSVRANERESVRQALIYGVFYSMLIAGILLLLSLLTYFPMEYELGGSILLGLIAGLIVGMRTYRAVNDGITIDLEQGELAVLYKGGAAVNRILLPGKHVLPKVTSLLGFYKGYWLLSAKKCIVRIDNADVLIDGGVITSDAIETNSTLSYEFEVYDVYTNIQYTVEKVKEILSDRLATAFRIGVGETDYKDQVKKHYRGIDEEKITSSTSFKLDLLNGKFRESIGDPNISDLEFKIPNQFHSPIISKKLGIVLNQAMVKTNISRRKETQDKFEIAATTKAAEAGMRGAILELVAQGMTPEAARKEILRINGFIKTDEKLIGISNLSQIQEVVKDLYLMHVGR